MTDISEKLSEIERNIQEGETMLTVLRRLPESDETNDQIKRFQDLVRQLEEYKERYKALQASPLNDFEAQLEALRDKHERIKMLLEHSALGQSKPLSVPQNPKPSRDDREFSSSVHQPKDGSVSNRVLNSAAMASSEPLGDSYNIEPLEWRLHYENQMRQLSTMLSQIARFQEMIGRLSNLVIGLDMTEAVNLLSDVGQRFTDVHLRLLSLQTAYEAIHNGEDPSDDFKANQLKDLRGFLISLGRSLEVTKECFFTVASIVKKTLHESNVGDAPKAQTASELNNPAPPVVDPEPSEGRTVSVVESTAEVLPVEEETDYLKKQKSMELAIAQLCKQREVLLNQLAEARAKTNDSTSSSKDERENTPELILSAPFSSFDRTSNKHTSASLSNVDAAGGDPLPILKRLQARKEHLEELRGELRSFSFPNGEEVPPQTVTSSASEISTQLTSLSSNAPLSSGVSIKVTPPRPCTSPHVTITTSATGITTSGPTSAEASMQTSFPPSEPPTPRRSTRDISPFASSDNDVVTQKCEVVTFQEPEATHLDNTERLYKSMREARIWREEHRQAPTDSAAGDKEGDKVSTNGRLRNGGLSESTSCMDATAMATWGGDSDREGNDIDDDMAVGGEYIEDVPSIVSSRGSRANRRFAVISTSSVNDGDGISPRACLGVHTEPQESSVGLSLPHLGHSPSPHTGESGTITTSRLPNQRQSSRPQPSHSGMAESSFEEYALTKPLAAKIANLEFKVEQLTQTCQILVTENARLSSALSVLLASQHLPPVAAAATSDWPVPSHSGSAFANSQQPLLSISAGGLFSSPVSHFRSSESVSGLSSAQSRAPVPLTPILHTQPSPSLEKALDQVQMLTAQVIEQHSRMNQLQNDLHIALQQQHQQHFAGGGDAGSTNQHLPSASGMRGYQTPSQPTQTQDSYQAQLSGFTSLMALQAATDLQSRQSSAALPPTKFGWSAPHPKP